MNYHSDEYINNQIKRHNNEALKFYHDSQIVGIFCQGSPNYGLDFENSDIDTKLILIPTFKDLAFNKKPISTTHILENNEHLDAKDLRLYFQTFVKQNLNFLEILFTPYHITNPIYAEYWDQLIENRELIAHMNPYRAVMSMYGIAQEKYHAMKHEYPSKVEIIAQHGFDGKQVSHLLRVEDYLERYIAKELYENCLKPSPEIVDKLMAYKKQEIPLAIAEEEAKTAINHIIEMKNDFCSKTKDEVNQEAENLLNEVQYSIVERAITIEFAEKEVYD